MTYLNLFKNIIITSLIKSNSNYNLFFFEINNFSNQGYIKSIDNTIYYCLNFSYIIKCTINVSKTIMKPRIRIYDMAMTATKPKLPEIWA